MTGSTDKQVKLWNITEAGPSMVVSRDLGVGRVFATNFAPDKEVGFRLAVAGSEGDVRVWDTSTNGAVRRIFGERVGANDGEGEVKERFVGVEESSDESSDDGQEGDGEGEGWEDDDDEDEDMEG